MTVPRVEYPPATPLALEWLRETLPGAVSGSVAIAGRIPRPVPAGGLVVPRRSGGEPDSSFRSRTRIDVQCWHDDWPAAELLAEIVQSLMLSARGANISGVEIGHTTPFLGPTPVADPASDAARYLLTVEWQVPGVQK